MTSAARIPFLLVFGLLYALAGLLPVHAEESLEEKVKAAFVYNFAKFVDWPASGNDTGNFNICVAGRTSFGDTLRQSLENKSIKNRTLHIRPIGWSAEQLDNCHMLYLNGSDSPAVEQLLDAAHRKPILTIGESDNFTLHGGMIRFLLVDGKVRFIVDQLAAEQAGLSISAKLLEVAFRVRRNQSDYSGKWRGTGYAFLS